MLLHKIFKATELRKSESCVCKSIKMFTIFKKLCVYYLDTISHQICKIPNCKTVGRRRPSHLLREIATSTAIILQFFPHNIFHNMKGTNFKIQNGVQNSVKINFLSICVGTLLIYSQTAHMTKQWCCMARYYIDMRWWCNTESFDT